MNSDGTIIYNRKIVLLNTLFFIGGISSVFFLLGLSFSALGTFFNQNKELFSKIGGITAVKMNPIIAFIMGFTFSFAWTPCVGPALSSVLILASSADNIFSGNALVLVYTLGFIIPFIILGLFTTEALNFFREKRNLVKYTIKAGGIILILIGIMTYTGTFTTLSRFFAR